MSQKPNGNSEPSGAAMELPLVELPGAHPCHRCGACCRYVAVEIDNPSSFDDYDHIYWYLTHRAVSVYVDWEGDWFIEFETVCEHLTDAITCAIYEERPQMCSDFSWNECEQTTQEPAWKYRFQEPAQLLEWMAQRRPRNYARYVQTREKLLAKRRAAQEAGAVPEAEDATPQRASAP